MVLVFLIKPNIAYNYYYTNKEKVQSLGNEFIEYSKWKNEKEGY